MQKFKIGDKVIKKNQEWGDTDPFTVGCIHLEYFMYGHGREFRYSSGFYEYGYLEHELSLFETYADRDGLIKYRPIEKLNFWMRVKSRFVQLRYKLKNKWRS